MKNSITVLMGVALYKRIAFGKHNLSIFFFYNMNFVNLGAKKVFTSSNIFFCLFLQCLRVEISHFFG